MAQQIMILQVDMRCERCRSKAFNIAAETHGVTALRIDGDEQEKLVLEGRRVNVAELVQTLKKKVGYTRILYVSNL